MPPANKSVSRLRLHTRNRLQPLLNINAWSINLLFFKAIDITLHFKNQSLIDLGSKTIVFKKSVKRAI